MRPIHEPAKPSKHVRYMMARVSNDERFSKIVDEMRRIALEFLAPASMMQGAASVVAHELRRCNYVLRQKTAEETDEE